jgi:hypothetical protein
MISSIIGWIDKGFSWLIKKLIRKEEIKDRHFNKIKEEVLKPLLNKIKLGKERSKGNYFLPIKGDFKVDKEFEGINQELLKDALQVHFPKVNLLKSNLEVIEKELDKEVHTITPKLIKQFGERGFYEGTLKRFFILGQDTHPNLNLHIDYDNLMYGSSIVCNSNEEVSKEIKEQLERRCNGVEGRKIRLIYKKLENKRDFLIKEIEKALATENLPHRCEFIK